MTGRHEGLEHLFGHVNGAEVIVVTPSGVELPLGNSKGWTAADLVSTVGDIAELEHRIDTCICRASICTYPRCRWLP